MYSDMLIEGWINPKTMYLTLVTKQHLLENTSYQIKTYEGKLNFNSSECILKGKVTEDGPHGKVLLEKVSFELDFTTDLWIGKYQENTKLIEITAFIRFKDLLYSGIAISDKGISLFKGLDINGKCNLVQVYIDQEESKEKTLYNFIGVKDTIENKYEGTIKHRSLDKDTPFNFELKGNPKKAIKSK